MMLQLDSLSRNLEAWTMVHDLVPPPSRVSNYSIRNLHLEKVPLLLL